MYTLISSIPPPTHYQYLPLPNYYPLTYVPRCRLRVSVYHIVLQPNGIPKDSLLLSLLKKLPTSLYDSCSPPSLSLSSTQTYLDFAKEYTDITEYSNQTAFQESPYGYDSVWAIADMLNRTMQYMQENSWYLYTICTNIYIYIGRGYEVT